MGEIQDDNLWILRKVGGGKDGRMGCEGNTATFLNDRVGLNREINVGVLRIMHPELMGFYYNNAIRHIMQDDTALERRKNQDRVLHVANMQCRYFVPLHLDKVENAAVKIGYTQLRARVFGSCGLGMR
eukprot:GHVO01056198.1.p1 GENE.GHVO01056198.1~~GHVO01056198.1.p1  ORF type:complete len:128 (-),score=12.22 GHVO01056198.1:384-767(-)